MPDVFIKLRKFEKVYNFVYSVFMLICKLLLVADILITSWIVELGRGTYPYTYVLYGSALRSARHQEKRTYQNDSV